MSQGKSYYVSALDLGSAVNSKLGSRSSGANDRSKRGPQHSGSGCCGDHSGSCTEMPESTPDLRGVCRGCYTRNGNLKRCGLCKVAQYCSRECQRKDWKKHKKICKNEDENNNNNDDDVKSGNLTLNQAKAKAESLFPGQRIIDVLSQISTVPSQGVFVGLIAKMHFYVIRHGIYMQDRKGKQTSLFFYVDYDKPEPYFRWRDLQPGRYICIANPSYHVFLDGQVGFRIDEASDITIIR